ncbi:hypothetical protein V7S43_001815 [Phytophthora oleae]|uniref:Secreted protein n=1 Tax=Phytophthora oleae TaxID=2107226 RepID=A0ABD3G3G2_9STRA
MLNIVFTSSASVSRSAGCQRLYAFQNSSDSMLGNILVNRRRQMNDAKAGRRTPLSETAVWATFRARFATHSVLSCVARILLKRKRQTYSANTGRSRRRAVITCFCSHINFSTML